jgi:hypothetical protein
MQCTRLPDNRAGLAFAFNKTWELTNADAIAGSTRERILKDWLQFPQWLRQDHGFQCMMDHFVPHRQQVAAALSDILGEKVTPEELPDLNSSSLRFGDGKFALADLTDDEIAAEFRRRQLRMACVDLVVPFASIATVASTAKTIVGTKCRSNQSDDWWANTLGFDGTASNVPPLIEFCQNTWATNAPGTNSTSVTPVITDFGRPETPQSLGGKNWTAEPTVLTVFDNMPLPNNGAGPAILFVPMQHRCILTSAIGGSIRVTQAAGVSGNATGSMKITE